MDPINEDGYCLDPTGKPIFFVPIPGLVATLGSVDQPSTVDQRKRKPPVERKAIRPDEDK